MGIYIFIILSTLLICLHINLSARVRKCERFLKQLKKPKEAATSDQKDLQQQSYDLPKKPSYSNEKLGEVTTKTIRKGLEPVAKKVQQPTKEKPSNQSFVIPAIIKENWMGVFGSVALVIGAVFFGLTAKIMQHPEVRVGVMLVASFLLLGVSLKLRHLPNWILLCGWLRSIAGTVILFATLGAGQIEGLKFIHSPVYAACFLYFGISINMLLATTTPSQLVASFHVILSIIAFCMLPQHIILLPIGALVSCVGLFAAYRSKWNVHVLLIVIAFAYQNIYWTSAFFEQLSLWLDCLAIGSSLAVGLTAACVHYSKQYRSPKFEKLPFATHLVNWILLTLNIWIHTQFINWTFILWGILAVVGFTLAKVAKKKKIDWLYRTDTVLAQLIIIRMIASMSYFSINSLDLSLIALFEILAFNYVCRALKEDFLLRIGHLFQYICYIAIMNYAGEVLLTKSSESLIFIWLRLGLVAVLSWSFYLLGSIKNCVIDDFKFVVNGDKDQQYSFSITTIFGTLFFVGMYFFGFNSMLIQGLMLVGLLLIALRRILKEDLSWNITFILSLTSVHLMTWSHLFQLAQTTAVPAIVSRVDFLGLVFLDIFLIFGNALHFKLWKKNTHHYLIYALGIQTGLLVYVFTQQISLLIPGLVFLGFSIFALEIGQMVPNRLKYADHVKQKIREGMTHLGLLFFIAFVIQFVTVHLQIDPIWKGISLRWITEAMGILTFFYWMVFYFKKADSSTFTQLFGHRLVEGCLGFITLCVVVEVPEVWRPLVWVFMAIGLLMGHLSHFIKRWPKRLSVYSWGYLIASIIHVAFITSSLTMPSLFFIERHNILAFITIIFQLCYVTIAYIKRDVLLKKQDAILTEGFIKFIPTLYRQPVLTVLLPVFLGIAFFFAYNFEKAILTLLWVGLTCAYLVIGLLVKSKRSLQIAIAGLIFCSVRLVAFDLVQSDFAMRALVFIGVGVLMLGVSVLYKKYKHRIETHERG